MSALNVIYEVANIPRSVLTHMQDSAREEIVKIATAARDRVCLHCGTSVADCVRAVIAGQAACCPDCTTLTIPARNAIREALAPMSATPEGVVLPHSVIQAAVEFGQVEHDEGNEKFNAMMQAIAAHVAARVGEERERIVAEIEVRTRGYVFSATERMACDRLNDLKDWILSTTPEAPRE